MDPPPPPPPHPNNDDDPNRNDDQLPVEEVQVNPPPVEVEHEVEVPSTVSSNPGLSENVRPESDAIASVESTVPCGDTSVPGTVESTETTATNQENPPVEVEQQSPPVDVEVKDANNPQAKDYLEQQQLQPVVEHEEALPVVEREEVPPVVEPEQAPPVEREVEVPSTVSSNPGLSGNLRSESVAIGPVESTVPCSDTSVPRTVESTNTIATNQSPSSSGTVCPAPSSTDIPPTQDTVTGENNADIAKNPTVQQLCEAFISELLLDLKDLSMFPTLGSQGPNKDKKIASVTKEKYNNLRNTRLKFRAFDFMSKPDEESIKNSFSSGGRGFGRGNIPLPSKGQMTVAEYKEKEQNRKQKLKTEERKVDPKASESVPQVLCKEGNGGSYIRISGKKESEGFYFQGQKDNKKEYAGKKQKAEKSNEFDKGEGSRSNDMQTSTGSMASPKAEDPASQAEDPSSQAEDPSPPALGEN